MALAFEESRMSLDGDLSNLSPCKSIDQANESKSPAGQPTKPTGTEEEKSKRVAPCGETANKQIEQLSRSWLDMIDEEENARLCAESAEDLAANKSGMELAGSESKMSIEEASNSSSVRDGKSDRKIEIDILDSANVQKYEKLIRDDKIKSPFKRRLSGGGEDEDGHARFSEDEADYDDPPSNQHKKSKTHENDHGRERYRRESSSSGDGSSQSSRKPTEFETDVAILVRRQKQIDYGKNTLGYENYMQQIPRDQRTKDHPKTPPRHIKYSRRAWDGLIKVWRKKLHCFDPDAKPEADC